LPAQDLSGMAHEVLEERKLPAGEVDEPIPAPHPARAEIHLQAADLDPRRPRLVGAPREGADARQKLLQVERLGEIVVGSGVQGVYLALELVAGGQHQDRHLRAPQPDALEGAVAIELRQHDVEQDQIYRFIVGQPHALLTVVGGDSLVAERREPALEEPHDSRVVLYDQDPHGARKYNRSVP
jgi:hypothetical protein